MLGHDHALSGALAFVAVAPLLPVSGTQLAVAAALTAGAGILPDLDEPGSTIARTFGFLTGAFAWIVHRLSGGHRKGTHSLLGVALLTAAALWAGSWQRSGAATAQHSQLWWHLIPAGLILALLFSAGFRALYIGGHHADLFGIAVAALVIWQGWDLVEVTSWHVPVLAVCVALGMLAHLAGDMLTHDGCPLLYPASRYEFGLLPEPVRITTNKLAERWIISPLLLAGLAYFVWRDLASPGPDLRVSGLALRQIGECPEARDAAASLALIHRRWEDMMTLKILPHGRLQEWVAEEQGYFAAEGLDYSFLPEGDYGVRPTGRDPAGQVRTGAFETFEAGRGGADISCACHWATNAAAGQQAGRLVTAAYSVAPCAIVVPPESPVRGPGDLAGVPIGVGYHSGSHFTTVQALEAVLAPEDISLTFQGPPNERLGALLERQGPAATLFGVPLYVAEAFGFRKVLDATFMIGFLVTGHDVSQDDVARYLAALRRAQMDIDLRPERFKHHHLRAVPEKYRHQVDVRTFGTGERIVFLPYTREVFTATQAWTSLLFPGLPQAVGYDEAILTQMGDSLWRGVP